MPNRLKVFSISQNLEAPHALLTRPEDLTDTGDRVAGVPPTRSWASGLHFPFHVSLCKNCVQLNELDSARKCLAYLIYSSHTDHQRKRWLKMSRPRNLWIAYFCLLPSLDHLSRRLSGCHGVLINKCSPDTIIETTVNGDKCTCVRLSECLCFF